jgi:hypothetical protein
MNARRQACTLDRELMEVKEIKILKAIMGFT